MTAHGHMTDERYWSRFELIERFDDLTAVVSRHADLVQPGGHLLLGCPNFRGVPRVFLERLSLELLADHNLDSMDVRRWDRFESELGLEADLLHMALGQRVPSARRLNTGWTSGYAMGAYRTPG
jgi:hypothetical protein